MLPYIVALASFAAATANAQTITRSPILSGWDIVRSSNSTATLLVPSSTPSSAYVPSRSSSILVPGATAPILQGKADIPISGGKSLPVNVSAPISRKAFLAGVARVAANPVVGIGLAVAAPAVIDWLGQKKIGINTDQSNNQPFTRVVDSTDKEYSIPFEQEVVWHSTKAAACSWFGQKAVLAYAQTGYWQGTYLEYANVSGSTCWWSVYAKSPQGTPNSLSGSSVISERGMQVGTVIPASLADIEPYMDAPDSPVLTPQVVEQGITKAGIDPFGADRSDLTISGPSSIPGEKSVSSEAIKLKPGTNIPASPSDTVTDPGTKTTTTQTSTNVNYNKNTVNTGNTINNTTTTITNNTTNQTTIEGTTTTQVTNEDNVTQPQEQKEIETCGLPGKPACKIDETGTPEPKENTAQKDIDDIFKPLRDLASDPSRAIPALPSINWAFTLPSGCAPIALPAFEPWLQEIDVCQFQPLFHEIMSIVWVIGGIFGAISTFWRNTFSQG